MSYKKLIVDGETLGVFRAESEAAKDAAGKTHLKGIEVVEATPEEFLDDLAKRFGPVVLD